MLHFVNCPSSELGVESGWWNHLQLARAHDCRDSKPKYRGLVNFWGGTLQPAGFRHGMGSRQEPCCLGYLWWLKPRVAPPCSNGGAETRTTKWPWFRLQLEIACGCFAPASLGSRTKCRLREGEGWSMLHRSQFRISSFHSTDGHFTNTEDPCMVPSEFSGVLRPWRVIQWVSPQEYNAPTVAMGRS